MGPVRSAITCSRKFFNRQGRASRSEYWWFYLLTILLGVAASAADIWLVLPNASPQVFKAFSHHEMFTGPIDLAIAILVFFPGFTVLIRRLHDTGKHGIFLLTPIVFFAVAIALGAVFGSYIGQKTSVFVGLIAIFGILLPIFWLLLPSQPGPNKYGPNPRGAA